MCAHHEMIAYTLTVDCMAPCHLFVSSDLIEFLHSSAIAVAAYIPGGVISSGLSPANLSNGALVISLSTGSHWKVDQKPDLLAIQIPESAGIPIGVWMAVSAWLTPKWIASHVLPFHAVALGWKGRALLLAGRSGAGKSTLALRCMAQRGIFLTGNTSLVSLDTFLIIGGTYAVTVRADQIGELSSLGLNPLKYSDRAAVLLSPPREPIPVEGIILPTLLSDDYACGGWFHEVEYPSSLHRLLPIATDVNNSLISLGDGDALVMGASEPSTLSTVTSILAQKLKAVAVHSVGGSVAFGAAQLQSLPEEWS